MDKLREIKGILFCAIWCVWGGESKGGWGLFNGPQYRLYCSGHLWWCDGLENVTVVISRDCAFLFPSLRILSLFCIFFSTLLKDVAAVTFSHRLPYPWLYVHCYLKASVVLYPFCLLWAGGCLIFRVWLDFLIDSRARNREVLTRKGK